MKKLLFCALALIHILTINTMDLGLKALLSGNDTLGLKSLLNTSDTFVTRARLAGANSADKSAISTESQLASSSSSSSSSSVVIDEPEQSLPGGLRQHISPYGSLKNRVSIADPYPVDDDNEWDIVSTHDTKDAVAMEKAQQALLRTLQLLPTDLRSCIRTNIHESENPLKELETARELIWACMTRTDPNFATSYVETLTKNFDPCKPYDADFNYSKVYAYLAYDNDVALREPNETFAHLVQERLDKAVASDDEKTIWFMRQFGFMFRDPATKQTYDAYLRGGTTALNALLIPEDQRDVLQECFDLIMEAKYTLKELQKDLKK